MSEKRIGRQTPTRSFIIPYSQTYGDDAIKLYNMTGNTALEWQELLLYDLLAYNDEGLWVHTKFGYSIPRRNGKSEVIAMREIYGLITGENMLHTAHRTKTSHRSWEHLCNLLAGMGLVEGVDYKTLKQQGLEEIRMLNGKGRVNFRTRSSKGALGEGFDLLVIDEAQEYTDDQAAALKYTVSSSMNPQTLLCGTPPTTTSSGTVFTKLRQRALAGVAENTAWSEWSVEFQRDVHDRDLWYETNPSLGKRISERSVADEIDDDDIDFNIQRLGLWIQYNQKSVISRTEWQELEQAKIPKLQSNIFMGVKFGVDNTNASLSVCCKTKEGKYFIESIDCRPIRDGLDWIVEYVLAINPDKIVIDGQNGQSKLYDELRDLKIKKSKIILPTVTELITANSQFEQAVFSKDIVHMGQPALENVVANCEHRNIGSKGGFGYRAQKDGLEIGLLDSCMLAYWACSEFKEKKTQKVYY